MALTPDIVRTVSVGSNKLIIKEKIIPNTAKAIKYVNTYCKQGWPMKPCRNMSNGPLGITVHNSNEVSIAAGGSMAEQYTRATWPNCNMGGVVVHFYVWKGDIWQNLDETEQGWHAADGSSRRIGHDGHLIGGNLDTISIEVIGSDAETNETAALLCAYLCAKYNLDPKVDIYTHNYWMYGKDAIVPNVRKNCPIYIFNGIGWDKFLQMCVKYSVDNPNVGTKPVIDTRKKTSGYVDLSKEVATRRIQYSLKGHGEYYLSEHFQVKEFACKDGRDPVIIDDRLVYFLELIYKRLNCTKMVVTSGYRPSDYEKSIGLSGVGQHVLGKAADIQAYDANGIIDAKKVVCAAEDVGMINGIGYISSTAVHIDSRDVSLKWWGDETVNGQPSIWKIKPNCTSWYDYFSLNTNTKEEADPTEEPKNGYVVQVGAYSTMQPVGDMMKKVIAAGFAGKTLVQRSDKLYLAQVGFYVTKEEAKEAQDKLVAAGITNSFIKYYK